MNIKVGSRQIAHERPCFVIAEIGNNHQGSLEKALQLIESAAYCGADAVKFQKRSNQTLYTRKMYDSAYEHENSFGQTYGEHREALELSHDDYQKLVGCAESKGVEFMCTPFDFESVDFLSDLNIRAFKFASGDLTNLPLLVYAAKQGKPIFVSTGAAEFYEIRLAYDAILKHNSQLCLLHCVSEYPAEYDHLNLAMIPKMIKEFPKAIIGYSGHDNGILAGSVAYMLGARVLEKHFTLNRAWKGSDHKFSLEPEGLRKQVRDLRRIDTMIGKGEKQLQSYEKGMRSKLGKGLYSAGDLPAGHVLTRQDMIIRSPGEGLEPYYLEHLVGKKLKQPVAAESAIALACLEEKDRLLIEMNGPDTLHGKVELTHDL